MVKPLYGLSQVFRIPAANEAPRATAIKIPDGWAPASGDTYHLGDTIEFEVTYSEAVDVRGRPRIGLAVSTHDRSFLVQFEAVYVRGSGTNKLVFAWDVSDRAQDSDGIQTFSNTLRLERGDDHGDVGRVSGGLEHSPWRNIGGKVDGTQTVSSDGVCGRTPQVRNAIVAALSESGVELCSQVTTAHLAGMTTLTVEGLTSLALGDFAGLSGLQDLTIHGSGIERCRWVCSTGWPAWRSCISRWG